MLGNVDIDQDCRLVVPSPGNEEHTPQCLRVQTDWRLYELGQVNWKRPDLHFTTRAAQNLAHFEIRSSNPRLSSNLK